MLFETETVQDRMAGEADLFTAARGGVFICVIKGQRDNKGASQNKPERSDKSKPSRKP